MNNKTLLIIILLLIFLFTSCACNTNVAVEEFEPSSFEFCQLNNSDEEINYETIFYYGKCIPHKGELGWVPEFELNDSQITKVFNNEKLLYDYAFERYNEVWDEQEFINRICDCLRYNDDLRNEFLDRLNTEEYKYQGCEVICDGGFNINGEYAYKYVVAKANKYGYIVLYNIYSKIDEEWREHFIWGISNTTDNCSKTELEKFNLLDHDLGEDYLYFGKIHMTNSNTVTKLFLDTGQTATIVYESPGFELGLEKYYICAAIEICKLDVYEVLKKEHLPKNILELYA